MTAALTFESFQQLNGEKVTLSNGQFELAAKVVEVKAMKNHASDLRQPFSVLFLVADAKVHDQQTYKMSHASLDDLDLFVVPIGPRDGGVCYEAVFG